MRITKVSIENYKSIHKLEFIPCRGLNTFIGENSVGKSNIFNAINWALGPTYPSFNSTTKQDHWKNDEVNKIKIKLDYDDGNRLELNEAKYTSRNELKSGLFYNSLDYNCRSDIRDNYCSAYLGIDREILDYLPSNRWTLIGRVLQQINDSFKKEQDSQGKLKTEVLKDKLNQIRDEVLFSVGRSDESTHDGLMDKFLEIIQRESAEQLNRSRDSFTVDLSLYDPWNFYRTLQLLVDEEDTGMQFQASSLGMGVQASITIAILKAYSELNLPNKTPIFIDEPELFLHPHAQRNFYKVLRLMSEDRIDKNTGEIIRGVQIFYSTHSPNFLRTDKFNEIFVVRKSKELGTYVNVALIDGFIKDYKNRTGLNSNNDEMFLHFKNAYENTGDSQKANEAFFAKKIILIEGQSESLILPYFLDMIQFDYIREGISIVRCGNKNELDRFFRLYNEFGIPSYIIFDGDNQQVGTDEEKKTIAMNKVLCKFFGQNRDWPDGSVNERYLGFEKSLNENLGFIPSSKDTKGLELFIETKSKIKTAEELPSWVSELVEKLKKLNTPIASVLNITEQVMDDLPF